MKKMFAIGAAVLLAGCTSNKSMLVDYGAENTEDIQKITPTVGYQSLENAELCCKTLAQLDYQKITQPGKVDFIVNAENPAFMFNTGKSFVKGIALPDTDGNIKIAVSSPIITSAFVPTVLVLDSNHQPIQIYGEETINYDRSSLLTVERYFGNIEIPAVFADGRRAKYLVLLTTQEAMQSTTQLALPDPSLAESGRADVVTKMYMDKPVPHTAIGAVRLAFDYTVSSRNTAQEIIPVTAVTASKIQPETEAMFLDLIEQAVKAGELDKAERFVEEAERAGSSKAQDALNTAVEKYGQ
ncbi:MAG: MalM family protein [Psychromonas sp.]